MAKQYVSFFERHVEKFVAGACGTVLLGVTGLYLVTTPNTATLGGDVHGPGDMYARIQEQALNASERMKRAELKEKQTLPPVSEGLRPIQLAKLDPHIKTPFAHLGPAVPVVPGDVNTTREKIKLAAILPPSKPYVTAGRDYLYLPPPVIDTVGQKGPSASMDRDAPEIKSDHSWVTLAGVVNRKAQNAAFEANKYSFDRGILLVAGIEVRRQELLAGGEWSQPAIVEPYSEHVLKDARTVTLVKELDGSLIVTEDGKSLIEGYYNYLNQLETQVDILRPPFQGLLDPDRVVSWSVPRVLKTSWGDVDLTNFERWGVVFDETETTVPGRPPASPAPAGPGDDRALARQVRDDLAKAEQAIKDKQFEKLGLLLQPWMESTSIPVALQNQVKDLYKKNEVAIRQAIGAAARTQQQDELKLQVQLGPDLDPFWATDVSVVPGKTYRYSTRVLALNRYAGMASYLVDPQNAGQVILEGAWSEWSDPVHVRPSVYLLLTTALSDRENIRLSFSRWAGGVWEKTSQLLRVGQPLLLDRPDGRPSSLLLASAEDGRLYLDRKLNRQTGAVSLDASQVAAMVLIRGDGEAEEHFQPRDAEIDAQIRKEISDFQKRQQSRTDGGAGPTPRAGTPAASTRDPAARTPARSAPRRPAAPARGSSGGGGKSSGGRSSGS